MGVALYYDLKYNRYIQVLKDFFPWCLNMQVSFPFYVKDQMRTMYWQMCGFIFQIRAQCIDS